MASKAAADAPEREAGRRVHPLAVSAGTLIGVVLVTFAVFTLGDYESADVLRKAPIAGSSAQVGAGACGESKPADASYSVDLLATPAPPRPEGTSFVVTVRHDGKPVSGAKVCVSADMPDMPHPGLTTVTKEASGGRYETRIVFGMGGSWRASVIVAEPDMPVVAVPMNIQVAEVQPN